MVAHTLKAEGSDASEDGTGRGVPIIAQAPCTCGEGGNMPELSDVVNVRSASGGSSRAMVFGHNKSASQSLRVDEETTDPLQASRTSNPAVLTVATIDASYGRLQGASGQDLNHDHSTLVPFMEQGMRVQDPSGPSSLISSNPAGGTRINPVLDQMAVRRLTPKECERLMGLPDDYTLIPYRSTKKKVKLAKDGPRYKAIGNSMAVTELKWLGERIRKVDQLMKRISTKDPSPE